MKRIPRNSLKDAIRKLSKDELIALAERLARRCLHVSASKAYELIDSGQLRGTIAESELVGIRDLIAASDKPKP